MTRKRQQQENGNIDKTNKGNTRMKIRNMTARTSNNGKERNMDWSPGQEARPDNKYKRSLTRQFDETVGQPKTKRLPGQYSMAKNTTEKRQHKQDICKRQ
jgi:hypothetical protein